MLLRFLVAEILGKGDKIGDSEESDRILVVCREFAEQGDQFRDEYRLLLSCGEGFG
jgi:hypothetical protein